MSLVIKSLLIAVMVAGFMVFFTTGCTQSIPEIEAGIKIPAPTFDNSQATLSSFVVQDAEGTCHKLIKRIEIRIADQGWVDLLSVDPTATISCATDGKFHFIADFTTGYLNAAKASLEAGGRVTLEVRGFGEFLLSEVGQIVLNYGASQSSYNIAFAKTVENRTASGTGNFVVSGEAKNISTPAASSTNFFVYGSLRSK